MKKILACLAALMLAASAGVARGEPLTMAEDLQDEVRISLNGSADYVYRFRYPRVDEADPSAELINSFFQYKADDAVGFEIPMNADFYRGQNPEEDVKVDIGYEVTCNSDEFFGVLVRTVQGELVTCAGYTFSRTGLKPGSSVALPYLLGMLASDESDTWLQDRQTAKADALVREMVWDALQDRDGADLELYEDLEESMLEYGFFPEEDFYLDETGNPVFYLQPGFAEDSGRLITFPISTEEILDEM